MKCKLLPLWHDIMCCTNCRGSQADFGCVKGCMSSDKYSGERFHNLTFQMSSSDLLWLRPSAALSLFRLPCSILVIMRFPKSCCVVVVMHCDLLPPALNAVFRRTHETHHRFLITSSSALQISLFCFSLGRKSGPSSQDLPHNLCPPKYVFPLATCLHLDFSPGRKIVKSFQSFAAFLLTVGFFLF